MPCVHARRAQHNRVIGHRRVGIDQARDHRVLFDELVAKHELGHIDRILSALAGGYRAHERFIAVLEMAVHHVEVTLVDRQVYGFTDGAAGVVYPGAQVSQFHEIAEVLDRRIAPAAIEVAHERRTV